MMDHELQACFPNFAHDATQRRHVTRAADRLWTRCLLEELTLDAHSPETIHQWMRFRGRGHPDGALAHGKGVLLTFPHAGNVMMLIALLAHSGYDYAQVAARGFPEDGDLHNGAHRPSRLNQLAMAARERAEDSLNAEFIPFSDLAKCYAPLIVAPLSASPLMVERANTLLRPPTSTSAPTLPRGPGKSPNATGCLSCLLFAPLHQRVPTSWFVSAIFADGKEEPLGSSTTDHPTNHRALSDRASRAFTCGG